MAVIEQLKMLHDQWLAGTDPLALARASYIMDYHCSRILYYCQVELTKGETAQKWMHGFNSEDILEKIEFNKGWTMAKNQLLKLRDNIANVLKEEKFKPIKKEGEIIYFDWKDILGGNDVGVKKIPAFSRKNWLSDIFNREFDKLVQYEVNGYGMYRFVALKNKKNKKNVCSCISTSLVKAVVLYLLGFPKQHIYVEGWIDNSRLSGTDRKQTHWQMSCRDFINFDVIQFQRIDKNLFKGFERNIFTTEAFASWTRDIIVFYRRQLLTIRRRISDFPRTVGHRAGTHDRFSALFELKDLYDKAFPDAFKIVGSPFMVKK